MFTFERETEREWGGAEREGDTDLMQAPGSELSAQSLMRAPTHKLRDPDLSQSQTLN